MLVPPEHNRYSTDSASSLASLNSPTTSLANCAVRADSPLLGFDLGSSADPLHYPSPDYTRELSLEHHYDACDKHARGLDPVHELDFDHDHDPQDYDEYHDDVDPDLDPAPRPVQSRSRSHSAASSTYLAFSPPLSRRASRLPSFSSTLDSPQPLPPAVIPALRERVSARSLHKQSSARSLRRTTTDSALSLLSSNHVSLAGIGTPDSVRNAVYFDSDHLGSLLLAASTAHPAPQLYPGRPSSTGSQVYLGPTSSTPASPRHRVFPSRSSDESSGACLETEAETPGTSPASACFDCASPARSRLSWADDTELAHPQRSPPRVYIHAGEHDDAEFADEYDHGLHDGEHTFTYGQHTRPAGLAPPQSSRWSLGSSVDAVALEKAQKKDKQRDSWGNARARKRDSGLKTHGKAEKKMGRRKRLVSFISSRFSAAPAAALAPVNQPPRLDVDKDLPSPLFDKELPPIMRTSPSPPPPPPSHAHRPTLALTIPIPPARPFAAALPTLASPSPSPSPSPSTAQATPTTGTSGSALDLGLFTPSSDGDYAYDYSPSRAGSPFVAAPGPLPEDEELVVTVTASSPSTEPAHAHAHAEPELELEPRGGMLSPTSAKTLIAPVSPVRTVFTPPPQPPRAPMSPPPSAAHDVYTYSFVDPPSPGLDPFRAASPASVPVPATPQVQGQEHGHSHSQSQSQSLLLAPSESRSTGQSQGQAEQQLQVQKKRSRRSLGIRGLAVRMGLAASPTTTSSASAPAFAFPPASASTSAYPYAYPGPGDMYPPSPALEDAYPTPSSPTKPRRRGPKRKLVISGIEEGGYEAVREWCEGFGEVKEMRRVGRPGAGAVEEGKGSLVVDFRKASVAETVCRLQAQVYIRGAGSVSLSWCTKTKTGVRKSGV